MGERASLTDVELFGEGSGVTPVNKETAKRRKKFSRSDECDEGYTVEKEDITSEYDVVDFSGNVCSEIGHGENISNVTSVDSGNKTPGIMKSNAQSMSKFAKKPLKRSVSFQEDQEEVVLRKDKESEESKARRESWRRSSGYGTGSGSKTSQQSNNSSESFSSRVFSDSQEGDFSDTNPSIGSDNNIQYDKGTIPTSETDSKSYTGDSSSNVAVPGGAEVQQSNDANTGFSSHENCDSQEVDVNEGNTNIDSNVQFDKSRCIATSEMDSNSYTGNQTILSLSNAAEVPNLSIFNSEESMHDVNSYSIDQKGIPCLSIFDVHGIVSDLLTDVKTCEADGNLPLLSVIHERLSSIVDQETPSCTSRRHVTNTFIPYLSILDNSAGDTSHQSKENVKSNKTDVQQSDDSSVDVSYEPESNNMSLSHQFVVDKYCNGYKLNGSIPRHSSGSSSSPQTGDFLCFIKNDVYIQGEFYKDPAKFNQLLSFIYMQSSSPRYSPQNGLSTSSTPVLLHKMKQNLLPCSRCKDTGCTDKLCNQIRMRMMAVKRALNREFAIESSPEVKQMIQLLYLHSKDCEEPRYKCPVKYCHIFQSVVEEGDAAQVLKVNTVLLMSFWDFYTDDMDRGKFIKLSDSYPENHVPDPEEIPILQFGNFGNVILFTLSNCQDYVLKKVWKSDREYRGEQDCLNIYQRLGNHPSIVPHLWLQNTASTIFICTAFCQGGTLDEYLDNKLFLLAEEAVFFIVQILDAVVFLHSRGIVYLYWSSSNVLFKKASGYGIQLSNLSMSVLANEKFDVGYLKTSLPPCIIPPELIDASDDDVLSLHTDSWGIGCLFAEMLTGIQMWHGDRHSDRDVIFSKVRSGEKPLSPKQWEKIKNEHLQRLLKRCWEMRNIDRMQAKEMLDSLRNNSC